MVNDSSLLMKSCLIASWILCCFCSASSSLWSSYSVVTSVFVLILLRIPWTYNLLSSSLLLFENDDATLSLASNRYFFFYLNAFSTTSAWIYSFSSRLTFYLMTLILSIYSACFSVSSIKNSGPNFLIILSFTCSGNFPNDTCLIYKYLLHSTT